MATASRFPAQSQPRPLSTSDTQSGTQERGAATACYVSVRTVSLQGTSRHKSTFSRLWLCCRRTRIREKSGWLVMIYGSQPETHPPSPPHPPSQKPSVRFLTPLPPKPTSQSPFRATVFLGTAMSSVGDAGHMTRTRLRHAIRTPERDEVRAGAGHGRPRQLKHHSASRRRDSSGASLRDPAPCQP
ncbi:hypothetical protein SKAU_G00391690 [Synaphobranchus kaupii]|uniref:Uncharacterized protein n=1 Tax=Synaphobranchus kaupii TaxID=118154 RepID=A0A9Q1EBP2_SYNKA|nr:hypothetical protein SKAU_G00391690 [Synaphobranchus kaupii]